MTSTGINYISTKESPGNPAVYNQAVTVGNTVYCSGCIGFDTTHNFTSDNIEGQTKQTLSNLTNVLKAAGSSLTHVLKVTIYLVNMADYNTVNSLYTSHFPVPLPARTCIAVAALPRGALIEIEAIAVLDNSGVPRHTT